MRAGCQLAAEGHTPPGGPLRREGLQGCPLVCLGADSNHQSPPLPADPPPPEDRRAGLSLVLRPRRPAAYHDPADPRRRAPLARGRRLRIRQGLLRPGPVPGPPLHRDRPPCRAGDGRPGHLRGHRRHPEGPHRYQAPPPIRPGQPPPPDPGMIPLTVPEIKHLLAAPLPRPTHPAPAPTCPGHTPPATPRTGPAGDAATRPAHAGTTSAPGSPQTL